MEAPKSDESVGEVVLAAVGQDWRVLRIVPRTQSSQASDS